MLRTDMTVPVARLAATRCDDEPLPLRFCYVAPSIRPWAPQRGQDGEFVQAGAELLGLGSAAADAECVVLLCDALAALGLRDFRVALGTVAFHRALVDSLGLPPDDRETSARRAGRPRLPAAREHRRQRRRGRRGARGRCSGPWSWAAARRRSGRPASWPASTRMDEAVEHLVAVRDLVEEAGFGEPSASTSVCTRTSTYYSGLIFEAYAPGVGLAGRQGGRYDGLLARFEWPHPGVGFAIALDRLHVALRGRRRGAGRAAGLSFAGGLDEPARGAELRHAGMAVAASAGRRRPCRRRRCARATASSCSSAATATTRRGGWRDVLRALGRRVSRGARRGAAHSPARRRPAAAVCCELLAAAGLAVARAATRAPAAWSPARRRRPRRPSPRCRRRRAGLLEAGGAPTSASSARTCCWSAAPRSTSSSTCVWRGAWCTPRPAAAAAPAHAPGSPARRDSATRALARSLLRSAAAGRSRSSRSAGDARAGRRAWASPTASSILVAAAPHPVRRRRSHAVSQSPACRRQGGASRLRAGSRRLACCAPPSLVALVGPPARPAGRRECFMRRLTLDDDPRRRRRRAARRWPRRRPKCIARFAPSCRTCARMATTPCAPTARRLDSVALPEQYRVPTARCASASRAAPPGARSPRAGGRQHPRLPRA